MPLFDPAIFDPAIFDTEGDAVVTHASIVTQGYGVGQRVITQGYFCAEATVASRFMRDIIEAMAKTSVSPSQWVVGQWEPGMWEKTPLTQLIKDMKK